MNWVMAEEAMGPRQIIGEPSSTMKPMDTVFSPKASRGISFLSALTRGSPVRPSMRGTEGP